MALDPAEAVFAPVPQQVAAEAIGRRIGQGDTGQIIEVGQIGARNDQGGAHLSEVERTGQGALGQHMGLAGPQIGVEGVGPIGADIQQGRPTELQAERIAVERAAAAELECAFSRAGVGLARLQAGVQGQPSDLIRQVQMAVIDDQPLDRRQLHRRRPIGRCAPVHLPGGVAHGVDVGAFQVQQGQFDPAHQQGQELDLDVEPADPRQIAGDAVGSADLQIVRHSFGREGEQVNLEVSVQPDRAPRHQRGLPADRSAQQVPVEQGREQGHGDHQHGQDPGEDQARAFPGGSPLWRGGVGHGGAAFSRPWKPAGPDLGSGPFQSASGAQRVRP